MTYFSLKQNSF